MKKLSPQNLDLTVDFLAETWSQGHQSDHPASQDSLKHWALNSRVKIDERRGVKLEDVRLTRVSEKDFSSLQKHMERELSKELTQSGPHRREAWDSGWAKNLRDFNKSGHEDSLIPGYFEKSSFVRLSDVMYRTTSGKTEATLLAFLVNLIVAKCKDSYGFTDIHEFGCGTGVHVCRLAKIYQDSNVVGYDWAKSSQELIEAASRLQELNNLRAQNFDFFAPSKETFLKPTDLILTVAALEQTGADFLPFTKFILENKPGLIINIEPMSELLDTSNFLGAFSSQYFLKRNYLRGYFDYLVELEESGIIEILESGRSTIGSLFIEGYSFVVWRPKP